MKRARIPLAVAAVAALSLSACVDDGPNVLDIDGVWARTSPAAATMGAAYMTITSITADQLVAVAVDESVAAAAEIHTMMSMDMAAQHDEMMASGEMDHDMGSGMGNGMNHGEGMNHGDGTDGGAMVMREIPALPLPAGEAVELAPGGYHVMLTDLANPLEVGETIDLTLTLASGAERTVTAEVRDTAP